MDEKRLNPADSLNPGNVAQGQVQTGDATGSAGLYSSDLNKYYLDSSLEVRPQPGTAAVVSSVTPGAVSLSQGFKGFSRRKAVVVSAIITLVVTMITGASILLLARNAPDRNNSGTPPIDTQDISLKDADSSDIPAELQGAEKSLLVNGDLITRGSLKIANNSFVTIIRTAPLTANQTITLPNSSGTVCLDNNNCQYASLDQLNQADDRITQLELLLGQLDTTPPGPAPSGVTALNNQTGQVTIQGSLNQVSVATAGGVITLSTPQNLDANANVQFGNLAVGPGGIIRSNNFAQTGAGNNVSISAGNDALLFVSGGRTFVLPTVGDANQTICTSAITCAAGGGQAVILGPDAVQTDSTANTAIFINDTGGGNLIQMQTNGVNRLVVNNSGDMTVGGTLTVEGLGTGFVRSNGGLLTVVSSINLGTSDVSGVLPVVRGGLGVTSLSANGVLVGNGTGAVTTANAGGPGECLVSTASAPAFQSCPGASGVSSLNGLNSAITLQGTTNRISVVTGAGVITLSTPQDIHTGASPTFNGLTLSGLGSGVVRATAGVLSTGNVNLATEVTGVLPLANGGTGISTTPTNGQLLIGNSATSNYNLATLTAGAGINIVNGNGTITISSPSGGTCATCANTSLSNLSSVAINTDLLPGSVGIGLGSTVRAFDDLFLDVASGTGSVRLVASSSTPGNYTITFPNATGTVCLTTGNCAGVGGAVGGTGTLNRLAKFTVTGSTIGDSILTDNGVMVSVGGDLTVTGNQILNGTLTSGAINGLTLQSNATGFQIAGGTSSKILTVVDNAALNQNLRTTDSPTFAGLTLTNPLTVASGGTGTSVVPANGALLIGNGTGYNVSTLTAGAGISIVNGSGSITISSPEAGTCTNFCADRSLSNLSGVSINTSLLPDAGQTVHLGSTTRPFQSLHLNNTPGAQGFLLTGDNLTGTEVTLTLPTLNGTLALVQAGGASSPQTGDLNIAGNLIGARVISALLGSSDSTTSNAVTLRSGNASAGNSGNVIIDVGTATGTAGTIAIGGTSATALTLGRIGLEVQFPGGINTQGANITTAGGNLDLNTGTITSGTINGQTLDSSLSILTGALLVRGAHIAIGGSTNNENGILELLTQTDQAVQIRVNSSASAYSLYLPDSLPSDLQCVTLNNTGQLATQNCSGGISGSGTQGTVPIFGAGGNSIEDSILLQTAPDTMLLGGTLFLGNTGVDGRLALYNDTAQAEVYLKSPATLSGNYTLNLPSHLDTTGKCLIVGPGGQLDYFACISSGGGGGGSGVTSNSATTDRVARWIDGGNFILGDSVIRDNGSRIGINVAPDATAVLTVGSSAAFKVTDAGALTVNSISNNNAGITSTGSIAGVTTLTASGLLQTSASGQALTVSGAPTNSATQSLIRVGNAISGGNTSANGGTYIGVNAPSAGAGSAADFINFQQNGVSRLRVTGAGAVTGGTYNNIALQANTTGFQLTGGTTNSRTLTVTANATIDQNLSTTSSVGFNSLTLATALGVAYGGTGIAGGPTADGQLLIGASGGSYTRATLTAGAGINITNGPGSISISAPGSGTCTSCADRQLSNLTGTTAIPVHLLPSTAGTINIGSASVPFRNLYLAGTSGTPGTNNFTITGVATAPRTITLPDATGTVCLTTGNCAGVGGGITGVGTNNTIAKFTGTGTIGDSTLTDDGTTVTVGNDLAVTNDLTAGTINGLMLQSNATGFQISGGTSSKTLTVIEDVALNQNLRTSDSPQFAALTLGSALDVTSGGTGINASGATNGQLLIGNGSGFSLNTLTSDGTVVITNGSGTIQLSAPGLGTCGSCANVSLSNLSSVNINTSLLAGSTTIDLGSGTQPFRDLYLGGTATNNFRLTGVASGGQKTLTLDNLNGRVALVQTAGGSSAQTGDIHVTNSLISDVDVQTTFVTVNSTSSGSTALISATNNNGSFTGNLLDLRYGSPTPTSRFSVDRNGAVTMAGNLTANGAGPNVFANSVQITTGNLQAPTVNATTAIQLNGLNINTAGTLTNVAYENQANNFTLANTFSAAGTALSVTNNATIGGVATIGTLSVTGNGTIAGGTLTVGASTAVQGSLVLYDGGSGVAAHTGILRVVGTLAQNTTFTLPDPGVSTAEICIVYSGTSSNCSGIGGAGITGSGTNGRIARFTGADTIGDSILLESGNNLVLNNGANRTFNIAQAAAGTGNNLTIQAGQGATAGNAMGGNLLLQAGAGGGAGSQGSVIVRSNGTNTQQAFMVQRADNTALLTADTTNMRLSLGTGTPLLAATGTGNLFVTNTAEFRGQIVIGTTTQGINVDSTNFQLRFAGSARNTKKVSFVPEFVGAVFNGSGIGYLTSDICSGSSRLNINPSLCAATETHNYYQWTTAEASPQTYNIYFRVQLPRDLDDSDLANVVFTTFAQNSVDNADNDIDFAIFDHNDGGTPCKSEANIGDGGTTWQTNDTTLNLTGCNINVNGSAGEDYITVRITLKAGQNNFVRIGEITMTYRSIF